MQERLYITMTIIDDKIEQWVVKTESGQVKGPYSTDVVVKMIVNGFFTGSEDICSYPTGEWRPLTKQPEFYDALIESLENPAELDQQKSEKMEAETVVQPSENIQKTAGTINNESSHETNSENKSIDGFSELFNAPIKPTKTVKKYNQNNLPTIPSAVPGTGNIIKERDDNLTIQLKNIKHIQRKELRKFIPFFLILSLITLVGLYLLLGDNSANSVGWIVLAPQNLNDGSVSAPKVQELKKEAVRSLQSGRLEKILQSQKELIQAIEGAPRDLESIGLLCIVHQQLWPYTRQTSKDLKNVTAVMQLARQVNPISNYAQTCQITYLLAKGQQKEAKGLVEKTLDSHSEEKFVLSPFLYVIKAEILESELNYLNASAYYEQASRLWPQWLWAKFGLARTYIKQNNFSAALKEFQEMLALDKESKAALLGLGLSEWKGFKNQDKSYQYFSVGYRLNQVLPKDFTVEALYNYAIILVNMKEHNKALQVSQEAYQLNPSHRGVKEMVLSLGGSDKIENSQGELTLLGDQFTRTGDHLAAVAQYKAAFELDKNNGFAAYKAAKGLWLLNQSREAINWLEKSIKADPKLVSSYALKADYESQRYEFVAAGRTLMTANRLFPKSHEILKGQALLEFRKNNIMAAIQFGERAIKIYDADVEVLCILAQAKLIQYQANIGVKRISQEEKNAPLLDAKRYAGRAVDLEPNWPESQITYAKFLAVDIGPGRAELYFKELIKNNPYTLEYRIALADFYSSEEKFSEAANLYSQVVEIDPKNKRANFGLAESYRILNRYDMAQKYYNATTALDPSDVEPLFANAKLVLESASGREASAKLDQALAKFKVVKDINKSYPRVSYYLAKCYLELGDFNKVSELIKEEKTNNPFLADPYMLAGELYLRKQQFKECATEYSTATQYRPGSADLYVKASVCYRKSGALEIAEDMLTIAKQKESGFIDIYREQGYIFEANNHLEQAVESWKKYLELSPNAPDRSTIEAKVQELGG